MNARNQDLRKAKKQTARAAGSPNPTPRASPEFPAETSTDNSVEPLREPAEDRDAPTTTEESINCFDEPEGYPEPIVEYEDTSPPDLDELLEDSTSSIAEPTQPFSIHDLVEPLDNFDDLNREALQNYLETCDYPRDMVDLGETPSFTDKEMNRFSKRVERLVDNPAPAPDYMAADASDDGYESSFYTYNGTVEPGCDHDTSMITVDSDSPFDTSYTTAATFRTSISSVSPTTEAQPPSPESTQSYQLRLGSFVDAVNSKAKKHDQVAGCPPRSLDVPVNARISYLVYVFSQATGVFLDESLYYTHQDIPPGTGITELKTKMETAGCFPSFQVFTPKGRRDIDSQGTWDEAILDVYNGRESEETQVVVHMFV